LLSRGYASSVADRGDLAKPSQAVRHNTPARSVSNRYLARRSRARVVLEPRASSQISKNSNNRQNRSIFENVDIRAEDTDVLSNRDKTSILQNCRFVGLLTEAKHKSGRPGVSLKPQISHSNPRFLMVERVGACSIQDPQTPIERDFNMFLNGVIRTKTCRGNKEREPTLAGRTPKPALACDPKP
jgi:hypothetical protein